MGDYFTCPYNSAHVMKHLRAHRHLIHCRRAHPHLNYVICRFNALHHIPAELEEEHLLHCEERQRLVYQNYITYNDEKQLNCSVTVAPPVAIQTQGESWDD